MGVLDELISEASQMQTLTRDEVQKKIWALTKKTGRARKDDPIKWQKKWLPSDTFILMNVPMARVDQPIKPHFEEISAVEDIPAFIDIIKRKVVKKDVEPIFIDRNCFSDHRRYKLSRLHGVATYVVDGKHRSEAAKINRQKTITAWVGIQAVAYLMDKTKKGQWWSDIRLKETQ